jgi:ribonucleoside-diphosphate reductase alpha chain
MTTTTTPERTTYRSRLTASADPPQSAPSFHVIRRNGAVTPFDPTKITLAMTRAFLAVEGSNAVASRRVHEIVDELCGQVVNALTRHVDADRALHIEEIQDQVELALMRGGHHKVARAYVLYREERARARQEQVAASATAPTGPRIHIRAADGSQQPLDLARLSRLIDEACAGLADVASRPVFDETLRNLYDGITTEEFALASIMAARTFF